MLERNERVVLKGASPMGVMDMILVGATHVGSIKINFKGDFITNEKGKPLGLVTDFPGDSKSLKAGEEVGMFKMGSTVVLVFEVPPEFEFNVMPGQHVRYGQVIGKTIKDK